MATGTIKNYLSSKEIQHDYRTTPVGYNKGGLVIFLRKGPLGIIRFVDYKPQSPTGLAVLINNVMDIPTSYQVSNYILGSDGSKFNVLVSSRDLYSFYNTDHSASNVNYSGEIVFILQ